MDTRNCYHGTKCNYKEDLERFDSFNILMFKVYRAAKPEFWYFFVDLIKGILQGPSRRGHSRGRSATSIFFAYN